MRLTDFVKAAAIGMMITIANFLITFIIVFLYGHFVEPGRTTEYYTGIAERVGLWSAPIGGVVLFFTAVYFFSRNRPDRNAFMFAICCFVTYVVVDLGLGIMLAGLDAMLTVHIGISLLAMLMAALAGAFVAANSFTARNFIRSAAR